MAVTETDQRVIDPRIEAVTTALDQRGYYLMEGVISAGDAQELRRALEPILHQERDKNCQPNGHQRVLHLVAKHGIFLGPLTHPLVLRVWRRYLSQDVICSTFTANTLWPGSTEQYWHCDHPYWTLTPPYPAIPLTGQCIWFLDDFTIDNGATAGIPGSHRRNGLPPFRERWSDDAEILEGPAGSVIFAHGAWWHTSRPNKTSRPRSALLVTYTHTFCVPQEAMRLQLDTLSAPTELERQLLGGDQYQPKTNFPY